MNVAIVTNKYIKQDGQEKSKAKGTIRYIEHRPGKEGEKMSRTLFGSYGQTSRQQAYEMIDEAEKGSVFYRIMISPDPTKEDTHRDLLLREITQATMGALEERIGKSVSWVAAIHADHKPHRHVHIVAVVAGRLPPRDFQALPQVLRLAATQASLEQRHELDLAREEEQQEKERKEAEWERER